MISIAIDWKDGKKFSNLIRYIKNNLIYGELQIVAQTLAHHAADSMINTIIELKKNPARSEHKLERAITAEQINVTGGISYGVGNIGKMNQEAPYWEMINDGAKYVTKETHVVPTTYFANADSKFITFKAGSTHVIEGIDYVGKAVRHLDVELKEVMNQFGEKFVGDLNKL